MQDSGLEQETKFQRDGRRSKQLLRPQKRYQSFHHAGAWRRWERQLNLEHKAEHNNCRMRARLTESQAKEYQFCKLLGMSESDALKVAKSDLRDWSS